MKVEKGKLGKLGLYTLLVGGAVYGIFKLNKILTTIGDGQDWVLTDQDLEDMLWED